MAGNDGYHSSKTTPDTDGNALIQYHSELSLPKLFLYRTVVFGNTHDDITSISKHFVVPTHWTYIYSNGNSEVECDLSEEILNFLHTKTE